MTSENTKSVYIVIVNWRKYRLTAQTLQSLNNQIYKNTKIILVDNESQTNKLKGLLKRFPKIIVVKNKTNLGFSKANNQGIKIALKKKAQFVLLLNNDVIVKKDFLSILVKYCIVNKFNGILNPKIIYFKTNTIWAMGGKLPILTCIPRMIGQGSGSDKFSKVIQPDYASGCALFTHRSVFAKVGLLDARLFAYYEDTDFSYRAKSKGVGIRVIPKSIIWHKVSQSTKHDNLNKLGAFQSYLYAKNGLLFGHKNFNGLRRAYYITNSLTLKTLLYLIFKCESWSARKSYINGNIAGLKFILNGSKNIQET